MKTKCVLININFTKFVLGRAGRWDSETLSREVVGCPRVVKMTLVDSDV